MNARLASMAMLLRLSESRSEHRLAPGLDASPLIESEMNYRRRGVSHRDFELRLLVSRMLAHESGRFPKQSVH